MTLFRRLSLSSIAIFLCFASGMASAWEKELAVEYALGDADSRITAREAAYEALKVEAAKSAKTYVQTTQTLKDEELTESIQVLGASMIELTGTTEKFVGNKGRNGALVVTGTASIDESELARRVQQIQSNQEKAESMKAWTAENRRLREKLESLRLNLDERRISAEQLPRILERQNETRQLLEAVGRQINEVFERGTLIELAGANQQVLGDLKDLLRRKFIDKITDATYQASIEKVQKNGSEYDVFVDLEWSLKRDIDFYVLNKIVDTRVRDDYLQIEAFSNRDNRGPSPHSQDIQEWLYGFEIVLNVTVGNVSRVIPILFAKNDFGAVHCYSEWDDGGSEVSISEGSLCLPRTSENVRLYGNEGNELPLKFTLPEQQAQAATGVTIDVVTRKPTEGALAPVE